MASKLSWFESHCFRFKVMRLSALRNPIVVKTIDDDRPVISIIPGYCWGLEAYINLFGSMPPYRGKSLYGTRINPKRLRQWPAAWHWADVKGHTGPPKLKIRPEHLTSFLEATLPDELTLISKRLGYAEDDPRIIGSAVIKSVTPGVVLEPWDTYTNNFEAIINVPVQMYKIADGTYVEQHDLFHFGDEDQIIRAARRVVGDSGI